MNVKANEALILSVTHDGVDTDAYDVVLVTGGPPETPTSDVMVSVTRADIEARPGFDPTKPFDLQTPVGVPRGIHTLWVMARSDVNQTPSENAVITAKQKPVPPVIVAVIGVSAAE